MDHSHNFDYLSFQFKPGFRVVSTGMFIRFGPTDQGPASEIWDVIRVKDVFGRFVVLQLNNGAGGAGYGVNLETNPGGVTTLSPLILITPGARYWCTMRADYTSGVSALAVYTDSTFALVGQLTLPQVTGQDLGEYQFGQGEEGFEPGTFSTFEHLVVDTTTAQFPLGPLGSV